MVNSGNLAAFKALMLEYLMERSSRPISREEREHFEDESIRLENLLTPEEDRAADAWIDEIKVRFPSYQARENKL